ncbi:MFS transporter, partial [Acinetobacter baumannii]
LIVTLSIMAAIGLLFFLIWELTEARPIVDLRLFRHRNFAAGALALVCAYSAFYAVNVIMPMWLQRTLGYTPIWAGLAV